MIRLPPIPVIDLRDGGPPRHAELNSARARALRDACLGFFPPAAMPLVPALDWASRRWLARSRSPYLPEIAQIANLLDFPAYGSSTPPINGVARRVLASRTACLG